MAKRKQKPKQERSAVARPDPLYLVPDMGSNAYVLRADLAEIVRAKQAVVVYRFGEYIRTVRLPDNTWWKSADAFGKTACDEKTFRAFLAECLFTANCYMPGSFGTPFHKLFHSPRLPRTINALYESFFRGGWQSAPYIGKHPGRFYQYDMNSAYLWSSTLGLPLCNTLEFQTDVRTDLDGCYIIDMGEPRDDLPYPFSQERVVMASLDEIEMYNLNIRAVRGGYTWRDCLAPDAVTSVVGRFSFAKQLARAYWGRWASLANIECESKTRKWRLRNPVTNYLWAHMIVSRVKMRIFETTQEAHHIFVDSIIVPHKVDTSATLGGWKLVKEYLDGIRIEGPGRYGPMRGPLDKHSGTAT